MSDEYSLADIQNAPKPIWEMRGPCLYCDGTRVYPWQLTDEELKQWFPNLYEEKIGKIPFNCKRCGKEVSSEKGKSGFVTHNRMVHPEWYEVNREVIDSFELKDLKGLE